MWPYWFLFLIFALGALRAELPRALAPDAAGAMPPGDHASSASAARRASPLFITALLFATLMIGLRYAVGTDFGAYLEMFEQIGRRSAHYAVTRIDPGYGLINWVVARAEGPFWLVNLICAALFMFGLAKFALIQPNPWLAIAVAVPYLIICVGMGYSRQAVAIAFGMAGLAAISRGSFVRFLLWVLAGALFHRTAVILIPIVTIAYSRNRLQALAIGAIGCVLGYYLLMQGQGFEHFQRGYVTVGQESRGAGIRLAMNLPPAILFLLFSRRFTSDDSERRIWRNFAVLGVLSFAALFLVDATTALDRIALYIIPLQVFALSRAPSVFDSEGRHSSALIVAFLVYSAMVQFVWFNYAANAKHWLPYENYLFSYN